MLRGFRKTGYFLAVAGLLLLWCPRLARGADSKLADTQLQKMMDEARGNPTNGYDCSGDYCFVRADLFARQLIKAGADPNDIGKIILRYPAGDRWSYHIATVYDGKVLDPLSRRPQTPKEWARSFAHGSTVEGDPTTPWRPVSDYVHGVVERDFLTWKTRGAHPEEPMQSHVIDLRKAQLAYIKSLTGVDYTADPRRVDLVPKERKFQYEYVIYGGAGAATAATGYVLYRYFSSPRSCDLPLGNLGTPNPVPAPMPVPPPPAPPDKPAN